MRAYLSRLPVIVVAGWLAVACASDKVPAEQAIKAAEAAVAAGRDEAAKFAPDQLKAVEAALASVKDKFAKGEYKTALAEAQALPAQARAAAEAAAAKKAELTKVWTELSAGLPKMVAALKSRVDVLSASRKLPANIKADTLAQAKSGLATVTQTWTEASEAFKNGRLADAVAKANTVKARTAEIMGTLGMQVPAAAKS
jgi:hypothetical protein